MDLTGTLTALVLFKGDRHGATHSTPPFPFFRLRMLTLPRAVTGTGCNLYMKWVFWSGAMHKGDNLSRSFGVWKGGVAGEL